MKNKRVFIILLAVLFILVPLGVHAAVEYFHPSVVSGSFYRGIADRIDFSVQNTEFTLNKTSQREQTFAMQTKLTVKKGEPDLYAQISDVYLEGLSFDSVLVYADENSGADAFPQNVVLYEDELSLDITFRYTAFTPGDLTANLIIDYISGLTPDTADIHRLTVPIQLHIENGSLY